MNSYHTIKTFKFNFFNYKLIGLIPGVQSTVYATLQTSECSVKPHNFMLKREIAEGCQQMDGTVTVSKN